MSSYKTNNVRNPIRFHPYSQNPAEKSQTSTIKTAPGKENKAPQKDVSTLSNYDKQYYLSASTRHLDTDYAKPIVNRDKPQVQPKGILKTPVKTTPVKKQQPVSKAAAKIEAQTEQNRKLSLLNGESQHLKIFTCNLHDIRIVEEKFNSKTTSPKKVLPAVGVHMFEFIAQLDSAVTDGDEIGEKKFTVKDSRARMTCLFNEIDVKMDKFARNSWIRCVGKYDTRRSIFVCMKVRVATSSEQYANGELIEQTKTYIIANYL